MAETRSPLAARVAIAARTPAAQGFVLRPELSYEDYMSVLVLEHQPLRASY